MNMILEAARLARRAHEGQRRKYNGRPYVEHPARVAARTALLPEVTEEMVAAAFLHDVIEDTPIKLEEIVRDFGSSVGSLVEAMTNQSKVTHPQANRAERKRLDRERLARIPRQAKLIKMIDRIDNLREMTGAPRGFLTLYGQESLLLLEALGDTDELLARELFDEASRAAAGA
jgi:(p)ppGpp synthase/HD superfamily hydrolase